MGTWGFEIIEDDLASDIEGDFESMLEDGLSVQKATKKITEIYSNEIADEELSCIVYLTLALLQLESGMLMDSIKKKALIIINNNVDLNRWKENDVQYLNRKNVLMKLKIRLDTYSNKNPKPNNKMVLKKKRVNYEVGHVFLVPLNKNTFVVGHVLKRHKQAIFCEFYDVELGKDEINNYNFSEYPVLFKTWCYHGELKNGGWEIFDFNFVREPIEMPFFVNCSFRENGITWFIRKGGDGPFESVGEMIPIAESEKNKYESSGCAYEGYIAKRFQILKMKQ